MNALKRFSSVFLFSLTACAPHHSSDIIQSNSPQTNHTFADKTNTVATPSTTPTTLSATVQKNNRAIPTSWDLSGAIAARDKNKNWTASINWLQNGPNAYQIRLFGPLGSGNVLIEKQGGVIHFRDGAKSSTSTHAETLLKEQTGVRLPVQNLYYWVRGLPAPGAVQQADSDASHHLQTLRQGGYTIHYTGYTESNGIVLPTHIQLSGNGVSMKMVIKRWKI